MRRRFGVTSAACTTNTVSMFAATVCDSARTTSDETRRVSDDCRATTCSTRSKSSLSTTQSPTATSAPMFRVRTGSPAALIKIVLHPRSRRLTLPTTCASRSVRTSGNFCCNACNVCSLNASWRKPSDTSESESSCASRGICTVTLANSNPYRIWVYVERLDKALSNHVTMKSHV